MLPEWCMPKSKGGAVSITVTDDCALQLKMQREVPVAESRAVGARKIYAKKTPDPKLERPELYPHFRGVFKTAVAGIDFMANKCKTFPHTNWEPLAPDL